MVDITGLAYQWWLRVQAELPEHLKVSMKQVVMEAFEQGYMAHGEAHAEPGKVKPHSRVRQFDTEDAQNLNQIMGALAEIKLAAARAGTGGALTYDVHMDSSRVRAKLRVPHMARPDCNCG